MDDYSKLSSSELLTRLLDGELDGAGETLLYSELAQNTELQTEMKDMLSIRRSIQRDTEAFTPPAELTSAVFSSLGFNSPIAPSPAPNRSYRWKYALLALLLISFPSYFAFDYFSGNTANSISSHETSSEVLQNNKHNFNVESNLVSKERTANIISFESEGIPVSKSSEIVSSDITPMSVETQSINTEVAEATANDIFALYQSDFNDVSRFVKPDNRYNYKHLRDNARLFNSLADDYSPFGGERIKTLNLRGIYALSSQENALQPAIYNSFTASAFITSGFMSNLSIGVEFGKEAFDQKFISNPNEYEQSPNVMWLAISAKYEANDLSFMGTVPFAQVSAGGSELGPIFRTYVGLSHYLTQNLGINIGVDAAYLIYKNNNTYYTSDKMSVSGGLLYRF